MKTGIIGIGIIGSAIARNLVAAGLLYPIDRNTI
jgi:3-hydroxyisobutyrate dehydrogenase-like beta-hydroxyacid dehydrogenase